MNAPEASPRPAPGSPGVMRLRLRLLTTVAASVLGFAVLTRILAASGVDELTALVSGGLLALGIGAVAVSVVIRPLLRLHADLEDRYAEALADALRDQLTGLGNHRAFHEELGRQAEAAIRYGVPLTLVLIDLDEFKAVNDSRGHAGGDRALRGFGRLLSGTLRRADRAFRVGGDEFAVILPHTDVVGGRIVARRLLAEALAPSRRVADHEPVSFSAGLSSLPALATGGTSLYAQADAALYAAKRGGRTDVVVFDPASETASGDAASSAAAIAEVVARNQLVPAYQPIVELATGRVIGVEGLIRPVPPAPFRTPGELFAAAEAGGRLAALDVACIESIAAGAVELAADRFLSINVSPATFEAPEFSAALVIGILHRHGMDPSRVVLEITETHGVHDVDRVRDRMRSLRRAGVRFAADDIGAGNAGLRLLAELAFDIFKVDLGLVQRSAADGLSDAVLRSVVELASRTGATVVAEGIESEEQVPRLLAMGIAVGQGYRLGRPGPLAAMATGPGLPPARSDDASATSIAAWRRSIGLPSVS